MIDRAFSYEVIIQLYSLTLCLACLQMEWHSGNFMSHTVLTLLYTRHLDSIDPDLIQKPLLFLQDPQRPLELITIVLRASVAGLLKCCDLTWRELSKGAVQDVRQRPSPLTLCSSHYVLFPLHIRLKTGKAINAKFICLRVPLSGLSLPCWKKPLYGSRIL